MAKTFDELTKDDLDSMLVSLRKSGVSPNTISSYARVFRTFLKWCRGEGYTDLGLPNIQDKEIVRQPFPIGAAHKGEVAHPEISQKVTQKE